MNDVFLDDLSIFREQEIPRIVSNKTIIKKKSTYETSLHMIGMTNTNKTQLSLKKELKRLYFRTEPIFRGKSKYRKKEH